MKKLLLLFIMALMLPFALAAPTLDFSVNPSTVYVNQQYTVSLTTNDAGGIDSIWYKSPTGDQKIKMCFGDSTCTATKSFIQESTGSHVHTFYAMLSTNGQGPTVQVPITVQNQGAPGTSSTISTQPQNPQTTSTYSASGAQPNTDPGTVFVTLGGTPAIGQQFTLTIKADDKDRLDSIWYFNAATQSNEKIKMCLGDTTCSATKTITETVPGAHKYKFVVWDSAGHDKIVTYDVNIGSPVGGTSSAPASTSSPSGGGGTGSVVGPILAVTVTPTDPVINERVRFDASGSAPRSGKITVYEWDFNGDDIVDMRTDSPVAEYVYRVEGSNRVRLAATDASGTTYYYTTLLVKAVRLATGSTTSFDQIGLLTITVNDNDGPVSGANVNIVGPESKATTTDTSGKAYFQVQPGCYTITATKDGKEFESPGGCVQVDAGQLKEITMGAKLASVGGLGISWGYIIAAILIIAAIGGGVYYYMNSDTTKHEQKMKPAALGGNKPTTFGTQNFKNDKIN